MHRHTLNILHTFNILHALPALCFIASVMLSSHAYAEIYKTVDKKGHITYTDVPPANTEAKPIELQTINQMPAPSAIPYRDATNNRANPQDTTNYQVKILAPENGTTLMAHERSVTVSISLSQSLMDGDLLAYKLDGETLSRTQEMTYTLDEPPRGEHSLSVDVVNQDDESLAQSNAITLLVMRPLVKQPEPPVPKKKPEAPK